MKSRKRRLKQDTSQDDPSDIEEENDELRLCLTIATDEDNEHIEKECFQLIDREDLDAIYKLVMDIYQDKIPEVFGSCIVLHGYNTLMTDERISRSHAIEKSILEKGNSDANAKANNWSMKKKY
ncbi:hypothetical protein Tco_0592636 [Tanacetum coccineum]